MKIIHCRLNHLTNPMGYDLESPTISYVATEARGKKQVSARVWVALDEGFTDIVYDSGERADIVSTGFELPIEMKPMTRYYWKVAASDDTGDSALVVHSAPVERQNNDRAESGAEGAPCGGNKAHNGAERGHDGIRAATEDSDTES